MLEPLNGQKQKGESQKAIQACNDWLRLGAGRSLPKLLEKYNDIQENTTNEPITTSYHTLASWSDRYEWAKRAEEYDTETERQKNERRREVMENGLALDFERTSELKKLGHFLIEQLYEQGDDGSYHNLWVPDVKQVGSGKDAERIDIEKFNAAIISELRGVLDDIAKETGGRKQRTELTGLDNQPIGLVILPQKKDAENEQ